MFKFDRYVLGARLAPAVLACLPALVTTAVWLHLDVLSLKAAATTVVWLATSTVLAQLGRDLGKKKEAALFEMWDGRPSTQLLRRTNHDLSEATRARYRSAIRRLMPDLELPTAAQESADQARADQIFDSVGDVLRELTRDRDRFHVLFSENTSYGFRRNVWGLKGYGLTLAIVCTGVSGAIAWLRPSGAMGAVVAANGLLALYWVTLVSPDWVRVVAFEYAKRLLASLDELMIRETSP